MQFGMRDSSSFKNRYVCLIIMRLDVSLCTKLFSSRLCKKKEVKPKYIIHDLFIQFIFQSQFSQEDVKYCVRFIIRNFEHIIICRIFLYKICIRKSTHRVYVYEGNFSSNSKITIIFEQYYTQISETQFDTTLRISFRSYKFIGDKTLKSTDCKS